MTTPQHRKGSKFERDLRDAARSAGFPAERCYGAGRTDDVGDICGVPAFAIEAKDHAAFRLSEWMTETEVERANSGKPYGALVVKRRMKPPTEAFAIMPYSQLLVIAAELERLQRQDAIFAHMAESQRVGG